MPLLSFRMRWLAILLAALVVLPVLQGAVLAQGRPIPPPPSEDGFNPLRPLMRLFGVSRPEVRVQEAKPVVRKKAPAAPSNTPPKVVEAPKEPDAGVVLVLGGPTAAALAEGLTSIFAQKPMIRVELLTEAPAASPAASPEGGTGAAQPAARPDGLMGEPDPAWTERAVSRIRGGGVKAVVAVFGYADLKDLPQPDGGLVPFGSDAFKAEYRKKLRALALAMRQERKPLLLVGLPPTEAARLDPGFTLINDLLQSEAAMTRSTYVDIWKMFLDDNEAYTAFGPDVDGQRRRLRANDGVGFTWAGARKVAFFVERELARVLGGYGGLAFEGVADDPNFIVLTGRALSAEDHLAGDANEPQILPPVETEAAARLARKFLATGDTGAPTPGRVDFTGAVPN
ncbi:SGNH/GDSL hydrolase family protein [Pannonibacter sp. Q-1]